MTTDKILSQRKVMSFNKMRNLKSKICHTVILYFCYSISCQGQDVVIDKFKSFIPDSAIQSDIRIFEGDLNRDDLNDAILRFKMQGEPEYHEHFYLLVGQENGEYKLATKNETLELDNVDGTVFEEIIIKNGYFSLEYIGYGNTSGSYEIITFKYSEHEKNWILHRHGSKLMHRYSEGEPVENMRTQKDFGKVLFADFGY